VFGRLLYWFGKRWQSSVLLLMLLIPIGWFTGRNMTGYPARFEDEGTYVSQAWAILYRGTLAHYTYWWDHSSLAWIMLAGWMRLTDALDRYGSAITAGREFVWATNLVSCALLYLLARRLGMRKTFAAAGVLLFAFCPLALVFHRYMLLDNIAVMWALAAFVLALSPRKHIGAFAGSALCMAAAIWTKETSAILLVPLFYAVIQNSDRRTRRHTLMVFVIIGSLAVLYYPLSAVLKGELFEGEGHVSLIGAIKWQLFTRQGSGSVLDSSSGAHGILNLWLGLDYWLLGLGLALSLLAMFKRGLRPMVVALVIQAALMLRPGYLPYMYVIALLPFAALVIVGTADWLWSKGSIKWRDGQWIIQIRRLLVLGLIATLAWMVAPQWNDKYGTYSTQNDDLAASQTVNWIKQNVPKGDHIVVDSAFWADLVTDGYPSQSVDWLYKIDTDPEVQAKIAADPIKYIAVSAGTFDAGNASTFPTLFKLQERSTQVASFGTDQAKIVVLRIYN
jgi:intracellular septation protein A